MPTINPVRFKFMQAIITFMMMMLQVLVSAQDHIMCIQTEREALLQFKAALVDRYGMLSSWTTSDCCKWEGIRCSNLTGHVLMLDLHGDLFNDVPQRYMRGEIHKSLMELQQLNYLNLSWNSFQGRGTLEFLSSLSNLRYLDLSYSDFGGKIPTQFGSLSNLKYLDLAWNSLEGSIPRQIGNLSQLQHLDLRFNSFEGNIPSQIGNLSQLQYLDLSANRFEGNIPSQIGNLSQLQHLDLRFNSFEGNIPSQIGNLSRLQYLDLSANRFEGNIPSQIGNLSQLQHLDLSLNSLEGSIPSQIGNLSQLQHLDLSWNTFEGSIPSQLGNLSNLQKLYLGRYSYAGGALKIDDGDHWLSNLISLTHLSFHSISNLNTSHSFLQMIAKLPKLIELRLFHCSLSDNFILSLGPSKFNFSSSFSVLDLSFNSFTSSMILQWLSNVTSNLVELDLSHNLLEGSTSNHFGRVMNSLEHLDLSDNIFKGEDLKSLANICTLHSLYILENHLSEDLPSILHNLSSGCVKHSLQELDFTYNQITGSLLDLSVFSSLRSLFLDGNKLSGKIPEGIRLPFHLKSLSIQSNSLEGGIPKSFGNSCALSSLDMSDNNLNKELAVIIHQLSGCARFSLQELNIRGNQINVQIGIGIGNSLLALAFSPNWIPPFQLNHIGLRSCKLGPVFPKWLETQNQFGDIDISNAGIADMVPKWFWANLAFRELISMNISYNNLHGIIPNFPLKNLYNSLILGSNQFDGPIPPFLRGRIPTSMGSLLHLQALLLRNNNLTDEIPFSLRSCTNLVMLDISENRLSGLIPAWIGSELQELQFLSLGRNNFHGSLPLQICYLSDIQLLDVSLNSMSGQIPKCIKIFTSMTQKTSSRDYQGHSYLVNIIGMSGSHTYDLNALLMWKGSEQMFKNNVLLLLKSIDLSSNHFSGEIPLEIENLFGLVSLNLSRNHLTGKIPSNIGKLTSLDFLDLSRNHLAGSIPLSLTQIDRLGMLDLSHNNLSGEIPTGTQLQSFNASCYEDNLDLCGPPLEKLCIDGKPAQEPIVKLPEDENLLFTREFYMSMAIGFVISFWGVFGSILINRSWRHAYFKFISNFSDAIYVMAAVKVFKWHHSG
ncbi:Receptor-like protein EIX2 [Glycine soja]|uniref:Receptor-like protein EIX2 n=1 Tax=Glycine soja TaxID=3848 RepID=A0A445GJY8_GLYSO|nr:Receptor-like protein EIX2 [Glycine soja]